MALNNEIGNIETIYVAVAILFFAYSSILGNYYYGEANVRYITHQKWAIPIYRISVGGMVMFGASASLDLAWSLADMAMGFMTICNLIAITLLGKYAFRLLEAVSYTHLDVYKRQTERMSVDETPIQTLNGTIKY